MGLLPKHSVEITDGEIRYEGTDLVQKSLKFVRQLCGTDIAMVFQDPLSSLNPVFTVGYQIAEPLVRRQGMKKREAREIALDLMKRAGSPEHQRRDRKSTRLNSSHVAISYAVFCLKKKT